MKQVHIARHAPEAHIVKGLLESNGIASVIRGEFLTSGWGELPLDVCSVWIADDAQYDRAQAVLLEFLNGDLARKHKDGAWRCHHCGEQLEGQFTKCWNCGAIRPA
ncbi:MAG TPA: DUF2007 domain-containing protein [Burkholderiales bacterium]|nr:DUF2007 domain-containing protein [Burkholderiales bacterium]